jgi:hypothetical protein
MHESDTPPSPPRFRRRARCQLVMAHNNGVGDVSTIQTTPPFEIYLAAHIQNVHKMIADHTALTTLASHRFILLILYALSLASRCSPPSPPTISFTGDAEIIFLIIHHLFILDALRHDHGWISATLHGFRLRVVSRLLKAFV